jgi:hypothetical protein
MTSPRRIVCIAITSLWTTTMAASQTPATAPREPIALGATTAQRNDAARVLVPLLRDVRRRAQRPVEVRPGTVPDSPFTGTQTTLFAFSVSKRSVPVDSRVVAAMDRLIAWQIDDPAAADTGHLFDQWLDALMQKNTGSVLIRGGGPCDLGCMTRRMANLDETWGADPRNRSESRDEVLLDALTAVAVK